MTPNCAKGLAYQGNRPQLPAERRAAERAGGSWISAQFIRRLTLCEGLFYRRCDNVTALAAVRIASITTLGLESIGTWLLSTS